ncbi:MAG: mannose-1-phosphate guanylyltransferase [Halobacteriovoraceae bacterium]|nr:mannose-1-phosphate guanylyltransferase [Halobacteriovoraceae bacterium]
MNMYALIMAGGFGTRLWPESTSQVPKQYLKLFDNDSLLRKTLGRLDPLIAPNKRFLVTVKEQKELALQESRERLPAENIILEPCGKNTAPCILLALACLSGRKVCLEDVIFITPSDHVVMDTDNFQSTLAKASQMAVDQKKIVTIGITPKTPHTGYGYIERGSSVAEGFIVNSFKEKPDLQTAEIYLKNGNYFWNAGMFVATMETFLQQFKIHAAFLYEYFDLLRENMRNVAKMEDIYRKMPAISIDYAVMEKSNQVMVVPAEFSWNDLGSWDAFEEIVNSVDGNTLLKEKGHFLKDARGNIVHAPQKFVSVLGVNDLIVVVNEKVVMILKKSQAQRVKEIIEYLKQTDQTLL